MIPRYLLTSLLALGLGLTVSAGENSSPSPSDYGPASQDAASGSLAVPKDVAVILHRAQSESDPAAALAILASYTGATHPLITLMRGQLHLTLANREIDAQANRTEAEHAFQAVADQETCRHLAHLGLAQIAGDRGQWSLAVTHCAEAFANDHPTSSELVFYAQAAYRARDWQLANILVEQGMMRFPDVKGFRQIEVPLLLQSERYEEARQALLALLGGNPTDATQWREIAWCDRNVKREDESLAALELASLSAPKDRTLARTLGEAQLGANLPDAALATLRTVIGEPARPESCADSHLIELGARAAQAAGETALGRRWLAAVPEAQRTRTQRLLAVRLAVQAGDTAGAAAVLQALIDSGERDGNVLIWAGHLAEECKDDAKAEAFYSQAAAGDGAYVGDATMRLGGLYYRERRWNEAALLLATYLAHHPDDQEAVRMQELIERRKSSAKR